MNESTGDRIRHFRQSRNLTQSDLGDLIGVRNNTISQWEKGTTNPSIEFIEKLCVALKITPSMLLGFEDEELEIKFKEYLSILDQDNILKSYETLIPEFKIIIKTLIEEFNKIQIDLELVQSDNSTSHLKVIESNNDEEYLEEELDPNFLIAASGGENVDEETMKKNIAIAREIARKHKKEEADKKTRKK